MAPQRPSRRALLALAASLCWTPACRATLSPTEVRAASLYFPPTYKHVREPRFSFNGAERQRALAEYREQGFDTLFEFVIDPAGKVKKSRLVRTHVDRDYHRELEAHARLMRFTPAPELGEYRAFYLPMKYSFRPEFEWL